MKTSLQPSVVGSGLSVFLKPASLSDAATMSSLSTMSLFFGLLLSIVLQGNLAQFVPPTPTVEPLYPKGLRMSIPHEDGISLVAYHVKFNEDFEGLEAGVIARDIIKTRNGRWVYEDKTTRLKRGDIIYYWIHVVYDGLGYNLLDQSYVVNTFYNPDGSPVGTDDGNTISCAKQSPTKVFEYKDNNLQIKPQNICPGQVVFDDQFDKLDNNRWTIVERFSNTPNYEFVVYMNNKSNVDAWEGVLHVRPTLTDDVFGNNFIREGNLNLEKCTDEIGTKSCKQSGHSVYILPPIISGRLNSKPSFIFTYGRIEIRAKLPRGDWIYPLITLESADKQDSSKSYHEIIIAHSAGNPSLQTQDGQDLSGHVLRGGGFMITSSDHNKQHNLWNLSAKKSSSLWSDSYHVYDLVWEPGKVTIKVDNEQYGEQQLPTSFNSPAYLNFGIAVGGHIVFPNICKSNNYDKPWKNLSPKALNDFYQAKDKWLESWRTGDNGLHIDYVKVWAI